MQRFEVDRIYLEHKKIILNSVITRYVVDRRTEKSVWVSRINSDGTTGESRRYKIHYYGDVCEYLYGRGTGNPRSVFYSPDLNLFAKDVEQ